MRLIIGLGNPGKKYAKTRHNLGFMAVDALAKKWKLKWRTDKKTATLKTLKTSGNTEMILAKPLTFMNESGLAVKKLASSVKLLASSIYLVHDDVDLELGQIKLSRGRGAAGHHGVESVIKHLGTQDFYRLRLGIGSHSSDGGRLKRSGSHDSSEVGRQTNYVLAPFTTSEKPLVQKMLQSAVKILVGNPGFEPGVSASRTQRLNH